jgi:histidine phosphotransferase ChpT
VTVEVDFRVLELLCARLCHELISPIGAINNGVELLDEDDPDFVKEALGLIGQSAKRAGQRLQFYRFAYGFAGERAAAVDAGGLAQGLLEGGKVKCRWDEAGALEVGWQRLACNLLVIATELLPRGGSVQVMPAGRGVDLVTEGEGINASEDLKAILADGLAVDALTARTIHAFFTMRLAQKLGARLALALPAPGRAVLSAGPA